MNQLMTSNGSSKKLKYLLYMSYLMAFAKLKESLLNRYFEKFAKNESDMTHPLHDILGFAPEPIIETILSRFTETKIDKSKNNTYNRFIKDVVVYKITDVLRDKLLAYIYTIALIVEDFEFDYLTLSKDLAIPQTK